MIIRDKPIHTFLQFLSGAMLIGIYNDPTEWPWTYMGIICAHGMFVVAQAARCLGLDNLVAKGMLLVFRGPGALARAYCWAT